MIPRDSRSPHSLHQFIAANEDPSVINTCCLPRSFGRLCVPVFLEDVLERAYVAYVDNGLVVGEISTVLAANAFQPVLEVANLLHAVGDLVCEVVAAGELRVVAVAHFERQMRV